MRTISVTVGKAPFAVTLNVISTEGEGLACFLYGGTLPHVGGQALASPGPMLHGEQLSRVDLWTATVPGHKDAEAAAAVARILCLECGEQVSVAAGIHVDDATADDLGMLMRNCKEAASAAARMIKEGTS